MSLTLGLFAALPLATLPTAQEGPATRPAQDTAEAPATTSAAAVLTDEELEEFFGGPLIVNGYKVPLDEFKRALITGVGSSQLEKRKYDIFLADELERRKAADDPTGEFVLDYAAIDQEIEKMRSEFVQRYPTLDFDVETERAFVSLELFRTHLEQQQLFDHLFLQNNPDEWPELTLEAIRAGGGNDFIDSAKRAYTQRVQVAAEQGLSEVPEESPVWKDIWRSMVIELLNTYMDVEQNPDELPPGVMARVEGRRHRDGRGLSGGASVGEGEARSADPALAGDAHRGPAAAREGGRAAEPLRVLRRLPRRRPQLPQPAQALRDAGHAGPGLPVHLHVPGAAAPRAVLQAFAREAGRLGRGPAQEPVAHRLDHGSFGGRRRDDPDLRLRFPQERVEGRRLGQGRGPRRSAQEAPRREPR